MIVVSPMAARTHGRYHHWDLHFSCAGTVASLMVGFKHHPNLKSNFEACSRAPRSAIWLLPLGDKLDERAVSSSAVFQDPYRAVRGRFNLAHPEAHWEPLNFSGCVTLKAYADDGF